MFRLCRTYGLVPIVVVAITVHSQAEPPKLPDDNIVEAWEKAGAEHGSIEWTTSQTRRMSARSRPANLAGETPAFLITTETNLASLPEPAVPFAIVLRRETGDGQVKALPTFKNLRYVLAYGQPLTDSAAKDLARQKGLRYLDLGRCKMTAVGMKELATLPELETLHVDSMKVTNAGLAELAKIKTLRDLNLDESGVTYDALNALTALQNLETLGLLRVGQTAGKPATFGDWVKKLPKLRDLRTSSLKDADLKQFADNPSLRQLAFDASDITAAGLLELTRIKDLEGLTLRGATLSAVGYKELAAFKRLQRLGLQSASVTDKELAAFAGMTSLRELLLQGTKVTDNGIAELKKALPDLKVIK